MNGASHPKGCPGAVNANGTPSKYYCDGNGYGGASFPWWKHCCYWDGSACQPNGKLYQLPIHPTAQ